MICWSTLFAREVVRALRQGGAGARTLAGGVLHRQVMREREPELEHPEQHQEEDRDDDRVFDEALRACALPVGRAVDRDHRTGSMRIAFALIIVQPLPFAFISEYRGS